MAIAAMCATPSRWRSRPFTAFLIRAAIIGVPVAAATGAGVLVGEALGHPERPTAWLVWVVSVATAGLVTGITAERVTRRYAPLAMLVRLSLIFPDQAPSRFRLALRASSSKRLHEWIDAETHGARDVSECHADTILTLALALNVHDRRTRGHSERVRALTELVADQYHLNDEDKDRLRWASLLHDIGKLDVPAAILAKPGAPTASELALLRQHPEAGVRRTAPLAQWLGPSGRAIGEHHERFDGTGYPHGLTGLEISFAGRIVALTDAFDTMTSVRSYKSAMSIRAAREEVARCAGTHFDPAVARAFLDLSLPRLWLVVGPASLLAQIPLLGLALRGGATELPALVGAGTSIFGSATALLAGAILVAVPSGGADAAPTSHHRVVNPPASTAPAAPGVTTPGSTTLPLVALPTVPTVPIPPIATGPLASLPGVGALTSVVSDAVHATQPIVNTVTGLIPKVTIPKLPLRP